MRPTELDAVQRMLPEELPFMYFADRESPWLLAKRIGEGARVCDLKRSADARWLARPLVKPVVTASGGTVRAVDLKAVAYADQGFNEAQSPAALAGVIAAFELPWHDLTLSFTEWGRGRGDDFSQMSRKGGNLVIQVGFPSDHAALMGRYIPDVPRKRLEFDLHPIRTTGRPTLAWARVDVDVDSGTALIEEVQSDWLRFAAGQVEALEGLDPRSRSLRNWRQYEADLRKRYGKLWPRATLLATLAVLDDLLGIKDVFMHQPTGGAVLKRICGTHPPASLYSALPKSFGFESTTDVPNFLRGPRRRGLVRLKKMGLPFFWHLRL
ncbi:MAG: hypothetical protein AAGB11_04930 [Pseudomonadota bacterium]